MLSFTSYLKRRPMVVKWSLMQRRQVVKGETRAPTEKNTAHGVGVEIVSTALESQAQCYRFAQYGARSTTAVRTCSSRLTADLCSLRGTVYRSRTARGSRFFFSRFVDFGWDLGIFRSSLVAILKIQQHEYEGKRAFETPVVVRF